MCPKWGWYISVTTARTAVEYLLKRIYIYITVDISLFFTKLFVLISLDLNMRLGEAICSAVNVRKRSQLSLTPCTSISMLTLVWNYCSEIILILIHQICHMKQYHQLFKCIYNTFQHTNTIEPSLSQNPMYPLLLFVHCLTCIIISIKFG